MDKMDRVLQVLLAVERSCLKLHELYEKDGKADMAKAEIAEALTLRRVIYMLTDDEYLVDVAKIYNVEVSEQ